MAAEESTAIRRRGRPRKSQGGDDADPRVAIVAAASALFAAQGIEAVTMAQVAERAGLQQSSIYYWFRSKADVLRAILEDVNRIPLRIVEEARTSGGPIADRLHRLIREDVLALCRFPFDINEIHRLAAGDPDGFADYWEERARLDQEVAALVSEGVASGALRPVDPVLAARSLLAADEATQNWFRVGGDPDYTEEDVAAHVAVAGVRSLLADGVDWTPA
ncbi:MAG: TetR/AcrR family transcriptional regulator [Actinobacteria bacterium]|nr:TetR/AcrR family transcriptional regulator [Actinomycetota bacterium]